MEKAIIESIKLFNNPEFGIIRTLDDDGTILFCGADIAKALGYSNPSKALSDHCKCDLTKRYPITDALGRTQEAIFVPESDLYRLAFSSKLPTAEKFTDWVTEVVLPSIRKNGGYIAGQEELSPQELMAKALLVANKTLADREARISDLTVQNSIMQPKADYFDDLVAWNVSTCFRATAKELRIPERKFIRTLIADGYVYRDKNNNLLPKAGKGDGLFAVKEYCNKKNKHGGVQTRVTPKGRETFRLLYADIRASA